MMEEGRNKCAFFKNGCTLTFDQKDHLSNHEKKCLYQEDECPQCDLPVIRKMLVHHVEELCEMRTVICGYCQEISTFRELVLHQETCPQKPVICEHCQQEMLFKDYYTHHETCDEKPHVCEMRDLGCEFNSNKEIIDAHGREIDAHFCILCTNVRKLRNTTRELEADNVRLKEECERIGIFMEFLKNDIEDTKSNHLEYRALLDKHQIRLNDFENSYKLLTKYADTISRDINEMKCNVFQINEQTNELKSENISLREEYGYHKSLILEIARKSEEVREETASFHKTMIAIEEESVVINRELGNIKEFMVQLEAENRAISNFNSKFKDYIDEVNIEIKAMKSNNVKMLEVVETILNDNKEMKIESNKLKDYFEVVSAENIKMKDNNLKLEARVDDMAREFKEVKEKFGQNMKREKESWTESHIEIKGISENYGSRINVLEEKMSTLMNIPKEEILHLQIGRHTWVYNKTFDQVKEQLLKQLYGSVERGQEFLEDVLSHAEIDEVLGDSDLGLRYFGNIQYGIKLKQGRSILTKDDRVVKLYVDQLTLDQYWPPERADRVMWCLIDKATQKVLSYQIKEGRLGTIPLSGLQYKVFGWFSINKDQLHHLRHESTTKTLHSGFLIYKNPT